MRSRRMRPVSWSTSYLLRSPLGISTSTSKFSTSSSTLRHVVGPLQIHAQLRPAAARRVVLGAVSRTMTPMREAKGSKTRRREVRHSQRWSAAHVVRVWLPTLLVLALLAAGVGAYRYE